MSEPSPKLRLAVLFGGRSSEHDVSVMSGTNVLRALDLDRYEPVPIFITRAGRWLMSRFADGQVDQPSAGTELCLVPGGGGEMLAIPAAGAPYRVKVDLVFPVLHGLGGEDGAVQGLAETAGVPFVGCGILGSATALDKDIAKRLLGEAGLPTAPSRTLRRGTRAAFTEVGAALGLPMFVKPARQGSSVGVSKVTDERTWDAALAEGFRYDDKLVVESFIAGREIECSVLESPEGELFVSRPGEIAPAASHGFYTFDAKYVDADGAALTVPAHLPPALEDEIRDVAARAFRAVGCDGMARVDVFVTDTGRVFINELNTIPGFTNISMYPKAMAASGVSYPELIDRLVAHGLARGSAVRDA